jgi:hypothetical protein
VLGAAQPASRRRATYWVREAARRLRVHGLDIVRTAIVASAAFGLASLVHPNRFFAPIAATLVMTPRPDSG